MGKVKPKRFITVLNSDIDYDRLRNISKKEK